MVPKRWFGRDSQKLCILDRSKSSTAAMEAPGKNIGIGTGTVLLPQH